MTRHALAVIALVAGAGAFMLWVSAQPVEPRASRDEGEKERAGASTSAAGEPTRLPVLAARAATLRQPLPPAVSASLDRVNVVIAGTNDRPPARR